MGILSNREETPLDYKCIGNYSTSYGIDQVHESKDPYNCFASCVWRGKYFIISGGLDPVSKQAK